MEDNYIENNEKLLYELTPKFNLLYEIFMPTGRKIKSTIVMILIILLLILLLSYGKTSISAFEINITDNLTAFELLNYISFIALAICIVKLIVHIVIQMIQYKHITYKFYESHMVYEDDFLNQHRK